MSSNLTNKLFAYVAEGQTLCAGDVTVYRSGGSGANPVFTAETPAGKFTGSWDVIVEQSDLTQALVANPNFTVA